MYLYTILISLMLCIKTFNIIAMNEKNKTLLPKAILKMRQISSLATLCEHSLVAKQSKATLVNTLHALQGRHTESHRKILTLLSEKIKPEFELLHVFSGESPENICYAGYNATWSAKYGYYFHHVHTLNIFNKQVISWPYLNGDYARSQVKCLAISPLRQTRDHEPFLVLPNIDNDTVCCSTFARDGKMYALGYKDGDIIIMHNNKIVYNCSKDVKRVLGNNKDDQSITLKRHIANISALCFSAQDVLYSSDEAGKNYVWRSDKKNKDDWACFELPVQGIISSIISSEDGSLVVFQHTTGDNIEIIDWHRITHTAREVVGKILAITAAHNILINDENARLLSLLSTQKDATVQSFELPDTILDVYPHKVPLPYMALFLARGTIEETKREIYYDSTDGDYREFKETRNALYMPKKFTDEEITAQFSLC